LSGSFTAPSLDEWKVKPEDILWDEAVVLVAISDLRGTKEALVMKWGDSPIPLKPGARFCDFTSVVAGRVGSSVAGATNFSMKLGLNGSRGIRFAPLGQQNEVRLSSTWPDPSFSGAFLPADRQITHNGFTATWQVSYYGRAYPQQWSTQDNAAPQVDTSAIHSSLFGVDLISVVDTYRYVERSTKYGVLFIALVFTAFFLFEVLAALRVHPFQYTLVGAALCLFYLALLSLSEIIPFGWAYITGAAASTLLIVFYSAKALRSLVRASAIGVELGAIYGFLYVILRLQDYSLVVGTAGLFLALAIVMYATRNIDWYARDEG
jgi:inner membrane protein